MAAPTQALQKQSLLAAPSMCEETLSPTMGAALRRPV